LNEHESSSEIELSSAALADVLRQFGDEHGFDPETCDEIEAMPFEEAFEIAYGYLAQAGVDSDEALGIFLEDN
jgi:hypothetical protein